MLQVVHGPTELTELLHHGRMHLHSGGEVGMFLSSGEEDRDVQAETVAVPSMRLQGNRH